MKKRITKTYVAAAVTVFMAPGLVPPGHALETVPYSTATEPHIFSTNDFNGAFDGRTIGGVTGYPYPVDPNLICENGSCGPNGVESFTSKAGDILYPVDSEFGFEVADFVGAAQKVLNYDYMEGWIGNITEESQQAGVAVSNAETATFKAKFPTGTWCLGLGSNSVKCESEHYTVMEHLISCNETVPYFYATVDGPGTELLEGQMKLTKPDGIIGADAPEELSLIHISEPTRRH